MSLGAGEYLIISSCMKIPYNVIDLKSLITRLELLNARFGSFTFLNMKPEKASFQKVWNGVEEVDISHFSLNALKEYFLSSLDMKFNDCISSRLNVGFLDEYSYEASLIFNYTNLIEEESSHGKVLENSRFVERAGLALFDELNPIYGTIGVERSVCGITDLKQGECFFPSDRVYFNRILYNKGLQLFQDIVGKSHTSYRSKNGGYYFRKTKVYDFCLLETDEESEMLSELIRYI